MNRIAVLLTSYNRKENTLKCLGSLQTAITRLSQNMHFDIFLVDDGSTDGTSVSIAKSFPEVKIINGSGNLFWSGGMRLAWQTSLSEIIDYDGYLLLNDDVVLQKDFFEKILITHEYSLKKFGTSGIYSCATKDPVIQNVSYGGGIIKKILFFKKLKKILPGEEPQVINIANANILLVTKNVVEKVGIIDEHYIHRFGDYDLTLRASKQNIPVLLCPGIGGFCSKNKIGFWMPQKSSLRERINYLYHPLGLSYNEQIYYLRKHFKFQLPYYFIMLWMKTLFPVLWKVFKLKEELRT